MDRRQIFSAPDTCEEPWTVSEEALVRFQRIRGLKLPDSYVELLKLQNGGCFRNQAFAPDDDDEEFNVDGVFGIGEERHSLYDLLEHWPVEDEQGIDISEQVVCFDENGTLNFSILDYRRSGPSGEPTVVYVSVIERPWVLIHLAQTFGDLLKGLRCGYSEDYMAWVGVNDDPTDAIRDLKARTGIEANHCGPTGPQIRDYELKHRLWNDDGRVLLTPNIDYAIEMNEQHEVIRARPDGPDFIEYPDVKWLFCCQLSLQQRGAFMKMLRRSKFPVKIIHEASI